jgi:hypothetical protein
MSTGSEISAEGMGWSVGLDMGCEADDMRIFAICIDIVIIRYFECVSSLFFAIDVDIDDILVSDSTIVHGTVVAMTGVHRRVFLAGTSISVSEQGRKPA